MQLDAFLRNLPQLWEGDPAYQDFPNDRRFKAVVDATGGMATENKLAVLNLAARHLDRNEVYLEIGAYRGTSIIGAALGNPEKTFVTVDNFSQFEGSYEVCRDNIGRFGYDNVDLVNADAWEFLVQTPLLRSVGVYFYDGRHTFGDQWKALALALDLLADEALVVVDDTGWRQVAAANRLYVRRHPGLQLVRRFDSPDNEDRRWWNGMELYAFRRANERADAHEGSAARAAYLAAAAYYDVVVPSGGRIKRKARRLKRRFIGGS